MAFVYGPVGADDVNKKSICFSDSVYTKISSRILQGINQYKTIDKLPRSVENGKIKYTSPSSWTSGFYPGCLWYSYELFKSEKIKEAAEYRTSLLEDEQYNSNDHDIGFKIYCSYGNAERLSPNKKYSKIMVQSAKTLLTRFDSKIGCIRSWDHNSDKWQYPVIIDNLMNLELLLWAFKETGDSVYYNVAISHADKTLKNHFRNDYSSYHVVDYDTITGKVLKKNTHQGYAHESAWSRGQAWALYGYTMLYRETRLKRYLDVAEKVADFILGHNNLPEDKVPYWDFDAPNIPDEPRDASSASIIASALYELTLYSDDNGQFKESADFMMQSLLSDRYFAHGNKIHSFLLNHSTGNLPKGSEIDVPIIYADYYLLEALVRKNKIEAN
jgi:hypothetical protein